MSSRAFILFIVSSPVFRDSRSETGVGGGARENRIFRSCSFRGGGRALQGDFVYCFPNGVHEANRFKTSLRRAYRYIHICTSSFFSVLLNTSRVGLRSLIRSYGRFVDSAVSGVQTVRANVRILYAYENSYYVFFRRFSFFTVRAARHPKNRKKEKNIYLYARTPNNTVHRRRHEDRGESSVLRVLRSQRLILSLFNYII